MTEKDPKNHMTVAEAARMARRLANDGQSREDIAAALAANGYKSRKTGEALSPHSVTNLVQHGTTTHKHAKKKGKVKKKTAKAGDAGRPTPRVRRTGHAMAADVKLTGADAQATLAAIRIICRSVRFMTAKQKLQAVEAML